MDRAGACIAPTADHRAFIGAILRLDAAEADRLQREQAAVALRAELVSVQDELRDLTDTAHRDEMARARQVARIEQLQAKAIEELGIDVVVLEARGRVAPAPAAPEDDDETIAVTVDAKPKAAKK